MDLVALDLFVFPAEAGYGFVHSVNSIRIAQKNGQKFVLFPVQGALDFLGRINLRIAELFTQLNEAGKPLKQEIYPPLIKRTILDLGTKFTRLQIAEIAETCKVKDAALIIETVHDMIAKHQIDAQYFTSTQSGAFN